MAWAELNGEPFRILAARSFADISNRLHDLALGTVSAVDGLILVQTGQGILQLLEVQPASKRVMSASDWYRGSSQGVKLS